MRKQVYTGADRRAALQRGAPASATREACMQHDYDYVIVGAGMAGDAAARALRAADADARIGLIGMEPDPPYDRPPLSKALWKDGKDPASVDRGTAALGVGLHLGRRVTRIDRAGRALEDDAGDRYGYRKLLLATGGSPRTLSLPQSPRVIHFRTLEDYRRLRALAAPGTQVAVVGGGFIGSELAAALCGAGCRVSLLHPDETLGERVFPTALSRFVDDYYREKGVALVPGVKVVDGRADANGAELVLSSGERRKAEVVVAGLGIRPNVQLALDAGLQVDDGIVADAQLRSSDPDIYVAGDVANFADAALQRRRRVEHEDNALQMGALAGRNMAGAAEAWTHLPFFYSDLFDLGYEAVGLIDARLDTVADWSVPMREGIVYYLEDGLVRGVLLWNVWGQTDHARALVAGGERHDESTLRGRLPR
jgi:NADPH-dependent 2,4-dienoyl-CoA reductase/sulfur reductase-like enzyme